ncbi:toll-like receptor Tollo isoform X1 [Ptychodera flava]|uniref:toll-like receptor Tollo isoform X1 n=2 Tax=Ptychodera flava TaxID=63121 RepID=UPI00396A5B5D
MLGISVLQTKRGVTEETAGHYKCEAIDEYNNVFIATATVTTNTAPPMFKECPQDMTNFAEDDGNLKATNVTWIVPTVKDNSENVTLYSNYTLGDIFQIGTTVVQYTALDSANNTAYCTFKVNVLYRSASRTSLIIGILVLCTCMFVLLPLFFCLGYRYRLQLYTVLTADMDIDYDDDGKDCDAFVLFSSRDEDFAEAIVERLEGNGTCRLLLHHRDFEVGKAILDNIEDCFDTSRASVLLISRNFLESGMCEHEARIALDNWINRKQRLIPIVIGDIKLVNDSKVIKRIVGLITYIQWPENGSDKEEEKFWKELEDALKKNVRKQSRIGLIKRYMLTLCRGLRKGYSRVRNNDV